MSCGGCGGITQGIIGVAKAVLGIDPAERAAVQARRDACRGCDQATTHPGKLTRLSRCRVCGCWIELKTKVASEECPRKKWEQASASQPANAGGEA